MKPEELMIGDWVVYNGDVEYTDPIRIEGIDITGVCITSDRDDVGFDGIQPIPLTAEILEKNGFTFKKHTYFLKKDGHYWINEGGNIFIKYGKKSTYKIDSWMINIDNENGYPVCCFDIFYVHELQHALKLCGIKKEIEL